MLADLTDTIAQLNAFRRREKVEIRVDDVATLVSAIRARGINWLQAMCPTPDVPQAFYAQKSAAGENAKRAPRHP